MPKKHNLKGGNNDIIGSDFKTSEPAMSPSDAAKYHQVKMSQFNKSHNNLNKHNLVGGSGGPTCASAGGMSSVPAQFVTGNSSAYYPNTNQLMRGGHELLMKQKALSKYDHEVHKPVQSGGRKRRLRQRRLHKSRNSRKCCCRCKRRKRKRCHCRCHRHKQTYRHRKRRMLKSHKRRTRRKRIQTRKKR